MSLELNALIIGAACALLIFTLYFRKKQQGKGVLVTKTLLSSLFVVAACAAPFPNCTYFFLVLFGLLFGFAGDICLALNRPRAFLVGLIAFLIGHIFYLIAFYTIATPNRSTLFGHLFSVGVGGAAYYWLKDYLGKKKIAVAVYIAAISLMLGGAATVYGDERYSGRSGLAILVGATLIYVSDIFVARYRFVKPEFINRLIGLPLYYAGQFLLAFSIRWIC